MALRDLVPWRRKVRVGRLERDNPFLALQREINRLFEDFFGGSDSLFPYWEEEGGFLPRVNVMENDKEVKISAELPGMDEKDVEVLLTKDALILRGEKKEEKEDEGAGYHRMERVYGRFERVVPLPAEVKGDDAEAEFSKGVLTVRIPKKESAEGVRAIEIKKK